jgi:hypothetical protein
MDAAFRGARQQSLRMNRADGELAGTMLSAYGWVPSPSTRKGSKDIRWIRLGPS